jgi:hypothetical protein
MSSGLRRLSPVNLLVSGAVLVLLVAGLASAVIISVFGDDAHSDEWERGYKDGWTSYSLITPPPPYGNDRHTVEKDCAAAAKQKLHHRSEDYHEGWNKACDDFFLTRREPIG